MSVNGCGIYTAATPYDVGNTLELPSWSRYDAGGRYKTTLLARPASLRASVENVFNENYWLSSSTLLL